MFTLVPVWSGGWIGRTNILPISATIPSEYQAWDAVGGATSLDLHHLPHTWLNHTTCNLHGLIMPPGMEVAPHISGMEAISGWMGSECDEYISIFEYSNLLVTNTYPNICSYQLFFYEYIRIFVGVKFFVLCAIAISKFETINDPLTHWLTGVTARRCYRIWKIIRIYSQSAPISVHYLINWIKLGYFCPSRTLIGFFLKIYRVVISCFSHWITITARPKLTLCDTVSEIFIRLMQ